MKKIVFYLSLVMSLVLVGSNLYAFGIHKNLVKKDISNSTSSGGNVKQKVDNIFVLSETSTQQYNNAVLTLNNLFSAKEEKEKLKEKKKALEKNAKVSEKNAILGKVVEDAASNLEKISKQKDLNSRISKLSADQKKMAGDCVFNMALANLSMVYLVDESKSVVSEVSANPSSAMGIDINKLKRIASNAPKQVSSSAKTITIATKLLKSGKIKFSEPKTKTETAKEIPSFKFEE